MNRDPLLILFSEALAAVDPYQTVKRILAKNDQQFLLAGKASNFSGQRPILVIGAGKAVAGMALAVEAAFRENIKKGLIIVKKGHTADLQQIEQVEASHPIPDQQGMEATKRILEMLKDADEKDLVICLISGGASALLVAPLPGIRLSDKQLLTDLLLKAGASITELNTVRKHLSAVKGGKLARAAYPAQLVTLILSDVVGDPLDVIASGPTVADPSTFNDAWNIIEKYGLESVLPEKLKEFFRQAMAGQIPETVKTDDPCLQRSQAQIVGGISQSMDAAEKLAQQLGFVTKIITRELIGDVRQAAKFLAEQALLMKNLLKSHERLCLLSGGETTVRVKGQGKGGRNQELALAFALEIAGVPGITLLSAGTDGTDGPTDAAGAIVDGRTVIQAETLGLKVRDYLENNDSYSFFSQLDALGHGAHHLKTGPTGTNVMDLQIILIQ